MSYKTFLLSSNEVGFLPKYTTTPDVGKQKPVPVLWIVTLEPLEEEGRLQATVNTAPTMPSRGQHMETGQERGEGGLRPIDGTSPGRGRKKFH